MFTAALFMKAKTRKQTKCPLTEEWMKMCNGILLSHKKEWNNATYSNMDGLRDYHTKWNKSERERQIPYAIIYVWNLMYDTNKPIHKTETLTQTEQHTCGCLGGWGWGREGLGVWDQKMQTIIYTMDKQQAPTVWHRERRLISSDTP